MDTCVCALTKPAVANLSVPSITFSALNVSGIFSIAKISLSLIAISAIFTLPSANKTLAFLLKYSYLNLLIMLLLNMLFVLLSIHQVLHQELLI